MMNAFSIGLVLTSLVSGALWSPPSAPPHIDHSEVIVKGHRVVVVEYEKEGDGNTKVLISPQEPSGVDVQDAFNAAGDKNPSPATDDAGGKFSGPRELVCDAFGKCKHKIAKALGKTKDKAQEMEEQAKETAGEAKEVVNEALGKAKQTKDKLSDTLSENVKVVEEKAKSHMIGESFGKVAQGIGKAKKVTGDMVGTVKDAAVKTANFDVVDSPKRISEDIQSNVTGKLEEGEEHVKEQAKEAVESVKQAGQKSLGEILSKLKEVTYDIIWYMVLPEKIDAVVGLIHMLGFSTAYGMCVWVTFISSYILGRYLPRQQFGMVQSRIYPVYFKAMAYCVGAALLGHVVSRRKEVLLSWTEMFQGSSLLSALLMLLTNLICLEPRATKVMFERMKMEKEEGRGMSGAVKHGIADDGGDTVARPTASEVAERQDILRMNEKLKKLNTYSSALNVLTLVVLTWHMAYMGQRLQATR